MAQFRVCKTLAYHRTLVYLVEAEDGSAAQEIIRADMGDREPIADVTEMDADPDDSYSAEEVGS
jgi:DNA-binding GntR family transcriptional regulator